jgi:hypothetical protein
MPLKTMQVVLSGWKGFNRWEPETEMDPLYVADCLNVEFDEDGTITKRRGSRQVSTTFSGTLWMIHNWGNQLGFTTVAENQRAVIVAGSTLYVVKGFDTVSASVEATFTATDTFHYAVNDDVGVCYISNEFGGVPKLLAYLNGAYIYQDATLSPPTGGPILAPGSADGLTGTFTAVYTYVDVWGNESAISDESAPCLLSGSALSVSVTASSDPTIDYIAIYVLGPMMSQYQLSGTFSNTTGTYTHDITMDQLFAGAFCPENIQPVPDGKYVTIHEDMLLIAGDPDVPDTIWCSNRKFHRQFSDDVGRATTGDGQPVVGFGKSYDRTVAVKSNSLHMIEGMSETEFRTRLYSSARGGKGQGAITYGMSRMAWWADDGFYFDEAGVPAEASAGIRNFLRTCDWRNMAYRPVRLKTSAYPYYHQFLVSLREMDAQFTQGENDTLLVLNWELAAWTRWKGNVPRVMGLIQNDDDYEYLYGGDNAGHVWLFTPPNYSGVNVDTVSGTISTTISSYVTTPWLNFPRILGSPEWERSRVIPRFLKLYVSGEAATGVSEVSLRTEYWVDFDHDTIQGTFDLTFTTHEWPVVKPYEKTIYYGGKVGTFRWVKFRFSNNNISERWSLHKAVFGVKIKPAVD